jgi:AcrR family transcriptional regulator
VSSATTRKTADERRLEILEAARREFAQHGLYGASTDRIARAAGISQPYLFRLFRTKKELFVAVAETCLRDTHDAFAAAAAGKRGAEALEAMGHAYMQLIEDDPDLLRTQMQGYAACDDAEICAVMRAGYGRLVDLAASTGVPSEEVCRFFAAGMLCNVVTMMGLDRNPEPWSALLLPKG